jgi:hypothetical protein
MLRLGFLFRCKGRGGVVKRQFESVALLTLSLAVACGASCTKTVQYCPLEEGRTWVYQFSGTTKDPGKLEPMGRGTMTNLAPRELRGKSMTVQKWELALRSPSMSTFETIFTFMGDDGKCTYLFGNQELADREPQIFKSPLCLIKYPVQVGRAWEQKGHGSSVIESIDDVVTVPAGTFRGCIRIKTTSVTTDGTPYITKQDCTWYAPGVGWIKSVMKEWHEEEGSVTAPVETVFQLESFETNGGGPAAFGR